MDYERILEMLDKAFAWSVSRTFSREEAEELTQRYRKDTTAVDGIIQDLYRIKHFRLMSESEWKNP